MAPTLEYVFTCRFAFNKDDTLPLGSVKGGPPRWLVPVISGYLRGSDIDAEVLPGGSECPLYDMADHIVYINARAAFRDKKVGDCFYVTFNGLVQMDEACRTAFAFDPAAKSTQPGTHTWFTSPVFEASNPEHKWLEKNWFVSQGYWHIPGDGTIAADHDVYMIRKG